MQRFISAIDTLNERLGQAMSWLVMVMTLVIVYDVLMRYLFQIGSVALQELEWHLFAIIFLLGAAYTLKQDAHVRVDIVYASRRMSDRARAWVDLLGGLFFLIPFCVLIIYSSMPFVEASFSMGEGSSDAGGLPFRFLLKACIPLSFLLLLIQGVALMLRAWVTIAAADNTVSEHEK